MSISKKENNLLVAALIVKPQGVKGEVKLECYTDSPSDLKAVKVIYIDNNPYQIEKLRIDKDFAYLKLYGINDRNAAELLRGKIIQIERFEPKDGRFFIADLIGCNIICQNDVIGKLKDILQYGSADIYVVDAKKPFMFAAKEGVITEIDTLSRKIFVDYDEFLKVAVYED